MNDDQPSEILYARDVLAVVGNFILHWGYLETAMLKYLGETTGTRRLSQRWIEASGPSEELMSELAHVAHVRNLLAHGLCGVQGRVEAMDEPGVNCRREDGSVIKISLDELKASAQRLDALRIKIDPGLA